MVLKLYGDRYLNTEWLFHVKCFTSKEKQDGNTTLVKKYQSFYTLKKLHTAFFIQFI